EKGYNPYVR
nr:RecName: Full=Uncharacterized protein SMPP3 [Nautilus macromphalus]